MKTRSWILLLVSLIAGSAVWAADDLPQENERQILGVWQAGRAVVEFLPEGKARIVERGVAKEGSYEINGDWLFVRVEGEDEKSGLMLIEGDRMTVDEHEFRRVHAFEAGKLIGKWTSDKADIELRGDGTVAVLEKSSAKGKSGRIEIEGNKVRLIEDDGDTEVKPFEIDGETLIIDGVERLERIGGERDPKVPIVGEWRHEKGAIVKVTPDGRFTMTAGQVNEGTYRIEDSVLTVKMDDSDERGFAVSLDEGALVLDGELRLVREGEAPVEVAAVVELPVRAKGVPAPVLIPRRLEDAVDAFLEARKNLVMMATEGLGAKHPSSVRAIVEARFLLKRCFEEAELLRAPGEVEAETRNRLEFYGNAFEKEIAEWGSR
jgi:hypothetical protein